MSLVESRPMTYSALFHGEMPYEPVPSLETIGLAGLWRVHTNKRGLDSNKLNHHLDRLPPIVTSTLVEHNERAHSGAVDEETIFGIIEPRTLDDVVEVTALMVRWWEKALWKNNMCSVLVLDQIRDRPIERAQRAHRRAVIIEAAAAVLQALPVFVTDPYTLSASEKKGLAKVLANWGPLFLQKWMNGDILSQWLEPQDISEKEAEEWQAVFAPYIRKRFITSNVNNPIAALDQAKTNLEDMTDTNIAQHLQWTIEEVQSVIQSGLRKHFAVINIANPWKAMEKVKANLAFLTDQNIAMRLGWTSEKVRATIPHGMRKYFSVHHINDPLSALERYAQDKLVYGGKIFSRRRRVE